ncbi:hypothetical protein [Rhodospirillum sp. A1_3_36]
MTASFTCAAKNHFIQRAKRQLVTTETIFPIGQAVSGETDFDFEGADT